MNKKNNILDKKLKEILEMDVKSDEFFEAYKEISNKYWTFENPSDFHKAAKALVMYAERYDSDKVVLCHKIIEQIINLSKLKGSDRSARGHCVFEGHEFYFDIYENERSKDKLGEMIKSASNAMENGKVKVKDQFMSI